MRRVLLVDAAKSKSDLAEFLRQSEWAVEYAGHGRSAVERLPDTDLVLLGTDFVDLDALVVCRTIRAKSRVPVIMLVDRDSEGERILALQTGADDCVLSTCGHGEVLARMEAVLRRCRQWPLSAESEQILQLGGLRIYLEDREVWLDERRIPTTAKEFDLLRALALRPTDVVSRKELMAGVWNCDSRVPTRTLDTHVSSLRAKLGSKNWILNVRGVGYRLAVRRADG
ncbi:response regulator [Amycolatopsis sp. RM579]|uniref:Sensory transduction protein RegX3 n=2 Tax=Amycolatopsis pithecellobii TaxID=664692 RepID=A0A6N7YZV8_9PSEU|nr:response regulator [Amycolatopsis pithecellobii]